MLLVMFLFEGNEERPLFRRLSLLAANEKKTKTHNPENTNANQLYVQIKEREFI